MGHRSIKTTVQYNRNKVTEQQLERVLVNMDKIRTAQIQASPKHNPITQPTAGYRNEQSTQQPMNSHRTDNQRDTTHPTPQKDPSNLKETVKGFKLLFDEINLKIN